MSKASRKARKLSRKKMNREQAAINASEITEEEYLKFLRSDDYAIKTALINKQCALKELELKLKIRPPEDEPPQQTIERAFRNAEIFLANKKFWKMFGFDDVPKDFTTVKSRASRFTIFFVALDGTIAQSPPAMKELDNPRYDERITPFLLEPREKPAHYLADYIARFQVAPLNQNPVGDYERSLLFYEPNVRDEARDLYCKGLPLADLEEFFSKICSKTEEFAACFDTLRNIAFALFLESKNLNESITEDFINVRFDIAEALLKGKML